MRLGVRLLDQRRHGGDFRRRRGGAGRIGDSRRGPVVGVKTGAEPRRVGAAQRPGRVAGSDHVHGARVELVDATRAQRADVVVLPAAGREVRAVRVRLAVGTESGRRAHADHPGYVGRRADAAVGAVVAGGRDHHHARGNRCLVGQPHRVVLGVRDRVPAEGLKQHVDVVSHDRVLDRLEDRGVEDCGVVAERVEHRQTGARGEALDPNVAASRQRLRRVDELRQVVDLVALRGDEARGEEGQQAAGHREGTIPAEVLEVEDDVLAVRPDEVGVARVDAVGDDPDLDAGAVRDLVSGVDVHQRPRLGLDQWLGRVARADLLRIVGGIGVMATQDLGRQRARPVVDRTQAPERVRHDRPDRRVRPEPLDLGRRDRRPDRVDDVEAPDVGSVQLGELSEHRRLGGPDSADPQPRGAPPRRQVRELVLEDDDRTVSRVSS